VPFVRRDHAGNITAVSDRPGGGFSEEIEASDPQLIAFLTDRFPLSAQAARNVLAESDLKMVRLVDDLVELLIDKGLIRFTELPPAAMEKYLQRQTARYGLQNWSNLIVAEDDVL
jgi:hypothetical protein